MSHNPRTPITRPRSGRCPIIPLLTPGSLSLHQLQNGYLPYTEDTYGCHGVLLAKRRARNPFLRHHPYYSSAPELRALLDWCPDQDSGGDQTDVFPGPLPWDRA